MERGIRFRGSGVFLASRHSGAVEIVLKQYRSETLPAGVTDEVDLSAASQTCGSISDYFWQTRKQESACQQNFGINAQEAP
jgi:hypothetical protein